MTPEPGLTPNFPPLNSLRGRGRVQGKVALVFGGGSAGPGWGNGRAAAMVYGREGARVAVVDIHQRAADETCELLRSEGLECEAYMADVKDSGAVARVVEHVHQQFGSIDILHNNVGITRMGSVVEMSEDVWHEVLDTNLTGVFLACKHVLPVMLEQQRGAIVNISSLASQQINRYPYPPYYAAKAGLNQLTRALAVQYAAQGIRFNAILPGVINTPLVHQQISGQFANAGQMMQERHAASPMGRMGEAWDVAYAALFLASDEARYITGVCLPVDGGKSCAGR